MEMIIPSIEEYLLPNARTCACYCQGRHRSSRALLELFTIRLLIRLGVDNNDDLDGDGLAAAVRFDFSPICFFPLSKGGVRVDGVSFNTL